MNFNNKNPNLVDEKIIKYHFNKLYNNNLNLHMIGGNIINKPILPPPIVPNVQQLSYGLPPVSNNIQLQQQLPIQQPMQTSQSIQAPQTSPLMQLPQTPQPIQLMQTFQGPAMQPQQLPIPAIQTFQGPAMQPQQLPIQPMQNMYMQPTNQDSPSFFMKTFTLVKNYLVEFIKENYGFVLIITLLIILLYIRYVEVSKKKKNIKNII